LNVLPQADNKKYIEDIHLACTENLVRSIFCGCHRPY